MCQSVSGNKQKLLTRAIECPQNAFFLHTRNLLVSRKTKQGPFFPSSITFSPVILQTQQHWHLYCFLIQASTSIVTHNLNKRLLRNQPGSGSFPLHIEKEQCQCSLCTHTHKHTSSVRFKMVSVYSEKRIQRSTTSLRSFPNVAFEMVLMFV